MFVCFWGFFLVCLFVVWVLGGGGGGGYIVISGRFLCIVSHRCMSPSKASVFKVGVVRDNLHSIVT